MIIRISEDEILRGATTNGRCIIVAANAHVATPAKDFTLVGDSSPALVDLAAASRGAVGAEIAVVIETEEAQHVTGVAVVAAVGNDGGRREGGVKEGEDAVVLEDESWEN